MAAGVGKQVQPEKTLLRLHGQNYKPRCSNKVTACRAAELQTGLASWRPQPLVRSPAVWHDSKPGAAGWLLLLSMLYDNGNHKISIVHAAARHGPHETLVDITSMVHAVI